MEAETLLVALCGYHRVKSIDVQDVDWLLPFNRHFRKIADYNVD
jgi:hypothetical protein